MNPQFLQTILTTFTQKIRYLVAIATIAAAITSLTGAILLFITLNNLCMLHAAPEDDATAEDLVTMVAAAAAVLSSFVLLLSTLCSTIIPAAFYRTWLVFTAVLALVVAAAALKDSVEVVILRGAVSKTMAAGSWSKVARCLGIIGYCATGAPSSPMTEACCSKPAGCSIEEIRDPELSGDDCHRWHPGTLRECYACKVCRIEARREVRLRARVPMIALLSGVGVLVVAACFHLYAEMKGKYPLPPRLTTTTTDTTADTATPAATV